MALQKPLDWPIQDLDLMLNLPHAWKNEKSGELTEKTLTRGGLRLNLKTYNLSHFLAGRWAANEATIKAHRHRKLHPSEISIIKRDTDGELPGPGLTFHAQALIDPPTRIIHMNHDVATLRGLQGVKGVLDPASQTESPIGFSPTHAQIFERRARVKEDERQIAEISISHDGDYAIAVCMALDEAYKKREEESEPIVDDGSGEPIHEPIWGDRGFLEPMKPVKRTES